LRLIESFFEGRGQSLALFELSSEFFGIDRDVFGAVGFFDVGLLSDLAEEILAEVIEGEGDVEGGAFEGLRDGLALGVEDVAF
jgi:hypothetical protein